MTACAAPCTPFQPPRKLATPPSRNSRVPLPQRLCPLAQLLRKVGHRAAGLQGCKMWKVCGKRSTDSCVGYSPPGLQPHTVPPTVTNLVRAFELL